jgi:hypothetical protein
MARRKKIWGANKRRTRKNNSFTTQQLERISKQNAYKIITGTDNLKSWGKTGWYKSKKTGEWKQYRSSIELKTMQVIDESEMVVDFDTECFAIPYMWGGVECNYIPDIILKTTSGKVFVIEVKPASKLNDARNRAKWSAAKRWCWEKKCKFFVLTEKDNYKLDKILQSLEDKNIDKANSLMEWNIKL